MAGLDIKQEVNVNKCIVGEAAVKLLANLKTRLLYSISQIILRKLQKLMSQIEEFFLYFQNLC